MSGRITSVLQSLLRVGPAVNNSRSRYQLKEAGELLSREKWSRFLCSSGAPREASEITETTANKAFRYVFLRTLPLRSQPEYDNEAAVNCAVADIEHSAARVVTSHVHRVVDERAKTHLHAAALAIASHRVLSPRLRDESRVMQMLRGAFGAGESVEADAKLPGYWFGKAALMFSPGKLAACQKMTANAAEDFGESFAVERTDGDDGKSHRMKVSSCLYADICSAEGLPQLTRIFCNLDRALFSHVDEKAHGVAFSMSEKTLADGNETECTFDFRQTG